MMWKSTKESPQNVDTKGMDYISVNEAADLSCRPVRDVKRLVTKVLQGVYPESMVRPDPSHEGLWQIKRSFVATAFSTDQEDTPEPLGTEEEAVVNYLVGHLELKNREIEALNKKLDETRTRLRNVQRRQIALAQPKAEILRELKPAPKAEKISRWHQWARPAVAAAALFLFAFLLGQAVNQQLNKDNNAHMAEEQTPAAPLTDAEIKPAKQVATD